MVGKAVSSPKNMTSTLSSSFARGPEVRPGARIDRDQPFEVLCLEAGEPHDLDEIFREVPEGPPRHTRYVTVARRQSKHDGEVLLRDPPPPDPEEVRDLSPHHGGGIRDPRRQALRQRGAQTPAPEGRSVEQAVGHRYAAPPRVC